MVYSHCEILWADDSGAVLGCYPTANYGAGLDDSANQAVIYQHLLSSNIIGPRINNSLANDSKRKLRDFRSAYTFNTHDNGSAIFFVILKIVRRDTNAGFSDINSKMEKWRCLSENMMPPKPTCTLKNGWMRYNFMGENIQKLQGRNPNSTTPHHAQSSRTTYIPGGMSGRRTRSSQQIRR